MTGPRLIRLVALALLGGILFIAGVNIAVAIAGPTITGFVAPLYAVFGTLFAVPLLGERIRPATFVAFGLAFAGTALLAGAVPTSAAAGGVALALVSAAMFGLYLVLARRWGAALSTRWHAHHDRQSHRSRAGAAPGGDPPRPRRGHPG